MQRDTKGKITLLDLARRYIKERYAKPGRVFVGMVHRLDGPVAGVVALARTSKAASRLSAQFRERAVVKTYLSVVQGRPPRPEGRLEHHLVRNGRFCRAHSAERPGSRKAALSYRTLDHQKHQSLLEITLESGRRHQIRTQLSAVGCPIVGDRAYGADQHLGDGAIALIAHRLQFNHPTLKTEITVETPPPMMWPWSTSYADDHRPLWTIEAFWADGLHVPE